MKQIPLERFFNKKEILLLQGASINVDSKLLNKNTGSKKSSSVAEVNLKWFLDINHDKDGNSIIEMPIVIIMLSPFYQLTVFQGVEAYQFINLFERMELQKPVKEDFNVATKDILKMLNGVQPDFPILAKEGFWKQNQGITMLTKKRLGLKKGETQFIFDIDDKKEE